MEPHPPHSLSYVLLISSGHRYQIEVRMEAPDKEASIGRNPHRDFAAVEASRRPFDFSKRFEYSQTPYTTWKVGGGASQEFWKKRPSVSFGPDDPGRTVTDNYKFIISSVLPRPIALISTVSKDGYENLAPFSFFNLVNRDPVLFSVSFVGDVDRPCDTLKNILDTGEMCVNIMSDWFIEAANYSSSNTPPEISEWTLSGLTQAETRKVKPARVAESVVSMEAKLHSTQVFSNAEGVKTACLVVAEVVQFHAWKDALDSGKTTVDVSMLRPIWRGGGILYGCITDGFELPRPEAFRLARQRPDIKKFLGL